MIDPGGSDVQGLRFAGSAVSVAFAVAAASSWCSVFEANADTGSGADFLDGSTHAIVMGPTGMPDPTTFPGYIPGAVTEYLRSSPPTESA